MLYLHIGLQKTGTTFLQNAVFPQWKGINYLPTDSLEKILRIKDDEINLLSREGLSGKNWSSESERRRSLENLSRRFPDAKILISFRKHSDFMISSYKQYLQRGGFLSFPEYFDIDDENGRMKQDDFKYLPKLEFFCGAYEEAPFVLIYERLINCLSGVLSDIQIFIGGTPPSEKETSKKRFNKSVGYYPAKLLRWVNQRAYSELSPTGRYNLYHWRLKRMGLDPRSICQYRLGFLPGKPMLSESLKAKIDRHYSEEWRAIIEHVERQRNARVSTSHT